VLEAILKDGSKEKAVAIVKEVVEQIRGGKLPIEKFVIETALTKPLDKYAVQSPELAAAQKANARGKGEKLAQGSVVRYVITRSGAGGAQMLSSSGTRAKGGTKTAAAKLSKSSKASVSDKAELLEYARDYDPDYYIDHQIIPTVLKILKELGVSEDDLKLKGKQHGLESFF
jgi:DNA polymerase I